MKIVLFFAASLLVTPAMADQLSDANVRNAAELMAFGTLCKTSDANGLANEYARMSGRPKEAKSLADHRIKEVKASGNVKGFCNQTRANLPNFAEAVGYRNNPKINPTVPSHVIELAKEDCKVAVPLRNTPAMRELYSICVDTQIGGWKIQQRWD